MKTIAVFSLSLSLFSFLSMSHNSDFESQDMNGTPSPGEYSSLKRISVLRRTRGILEAHEEAQVLSFTKLRVAPIFIMLATQVLRRTIVSFPKCFISAMRKIEIEFSYIGCMEFFERSGLRYGWDCYPFKAQEKEKAICLDSKRLIQLHQNH